MTNWILTGLACGFVMQAISDFMTEKESMQMSLWAWLFCVAAWAFCWPCVLAYLALATYRGIKEKTKAAKPSGQSSVKNPPTSDSKQETKKVD